MRIQTQMSCCITQMYSLIEKKNNKKWCVLKDFVIFLNCFLMSKGSNWKKRVVKIPSWFNFVVVLCDDPCGFLPTQDMLWYHDSLVCVKQHIELSPHHIYIKTTNIWSNDIS